MKKNKARPAFPWDEAMAFGFGVLKLGATEFWSLTPIELAAAMRAYGAKSSAPMNRQSMDKLMQEFPDPPASGEGTQID